MVRKPIRTVKRLCPESKIGCRPWEHQALLWPEKNNRKYRKPTRTVRKLGTATPKPMRNELSMLVTANSSESLQKFVISYWRHRRHNSIGLNWPGRLASVWPALLDDMTFTYSSPFDRSVLMITIRRLDASKWETLSVSSGCWTESLKIVEAVSLP